MSEKETLEKLTAKLAESSGDEEQALLLEIKEMKKTSKSFDDLEFELGEAEGAHHNRIEFNSLEDLAETHDENGEPLVKEPPRLDYEQMASIVHHTIAAYKGELHGVDAEFIPSFSVLDDASRQKYIARVAMVIQSASDPNDENLARVFHAQDSMELLTKGFTYGEEYISNADVKASPLVAPWEYTKPEDKVEYFLFRRTVKSLLAVWNGH